MSFPQMNLPTGEAGSPCDSGRGAVASRGVSAGPRVPKAVLLAAHSLTRCPARGQLSPVINIPRGKFLVSKLTDPPDASGERKILRPVARPWASANDLPWGHVCERGTLSGTGGWLSAMVDVARLSPPREATAVAGRPEEASAREGKARGDRLCARIPWTSLSGRSPGRGRSDGAGAGAGGSFNTRDAFPSEASRQQHRLGSSFQVFSFEEACAASAAGRAPAPLPRPRAGEASFQMLDYINFSAGSSP